MSETEAAAKPELTVTVTIPGRSAPIIQEVLELGMREAERKWPGGFTRLDLEWRDIPAKCHASPAHRGELSCMVLAGSDVHACRVRVSIDPTRMGPDTGEGDVITPWTFVWAQNPVDEAF